MKREVPDEEAAHGQEHHAVPAGPGEAGVVALPQPQENERFSGPGPCDPEQAELHGNRQG